MIHILHYSEIDFVRFGNHLTPRVPMTPNSPAGPNSPSGSPLRVKMFELYEERSKRKKTWVDLPLG